MQQIIRDGSVTEDNWCFAGDKDALNNLEENANCIFLDYALWLEVKDSLNPDKLWGITLNPDQEPSCLADDLQKLSAVALNFSTFMDGRGFSQARELRERYKFEGEIRVVGDFIRDQLFFLKRCGVNAFQFSSDADLHEALASFGDFSNAYQASATDLEPLFRKR